MRVAITEHRTLDDALKKLRAGMSPTFGELSRKRHFVGPSERRKHKRLRARRRRSKTGDRRQ